MKRAFLFSLVLVTAFLASGCSYNELTRMQQRVRSTWANIETQLQRRADLIGNLAEAAKMAGVQEQEVFGQIADARSRLLNTAAQAPQGNDGDKTPEQKMAVLEANNGLGSALGRLLMIQENYPVLRSNEAFLKLQDELAGTENRISVARIDYNKAVEEYNGTRNSFPTVLTASLFGFKEEPFFQADPGATQAPRLDANSMRRQQAPAAPAAPANR
jgi:LemA protein